MDGWRPGLAPRLTQPYRPCCYVTLRWAVAGARPIYYGHQAGLSRHGGQLGAGVRQLSVRRTAPRRTRLRFGRKRSKRSSDGRFGTTEGPPGRLRHLERGMCPPRHDPRRSFMRCWKSWDRASLRRRAAWLEKRVRIRLLPKGKYHGEALDERTRLSRQIRPSEDGFRSIFDQGQLVLKFAGELCRLVRSLETFDQESVRHQTRPRYNGMNLI